MAIPQVAFVPETRAARARLAEGALSGLSFAAKDVFALRDHVSTAGHPDWARTHSAATRDASVIKSLLEAGADLVGVTILDELAYSLTGENPHYGTPENPRAPGRYCGGSSCGSAAAVAASLCDFAIGTDTAGSIRVPAAFCGLFGMRPSFGGLPCDGVVPLAPSFDTVGFLARDAQTFGAVGAVLFGDDAAPTFERVLVAEDALALCDAGISELCEHFLERAVRALHADLERTRIAPYAFSELREVFRRLQARDVWRTHGAWVSEVEPVFSPPIAARFEFARELARGDDPELERDLEVRARVVERVREVVTPGTLLFLPAAPGVAPRMGAPPAELEQTRARMLELTSLASLSGAPQLVVPLRALSGPPVALSFVGALGSDASFVHAATVIDGALGV